MAVATVWAQNCQKEQTKLTSAQDNEWNPDSCDLDNSWDLFALTSPYKSPCTSLCVTLALSGSSQIDNCCCCCCCCDCHLLFSVTFGAGRGLERVFRTVFDLRSERLLCRCTMLAQDRVRWSQVTLFAKSAIPDLVLGIILSNKRHPDYVSNDCGSALFEELCNHHCVLLHRSLQQKG